MCGSDLNAVSEVKLVSIQMSKFQENENAN